MSQAKKLVRARFNEATFKRDRFACVLCPPGTRHAVEDLDAHHITDRNEMPNGGYVRDNGVTVCKPHHIEVEAGHPSPEALYRLIGSSYERALAASQRLR